MTMPTPLWRAVALSIAFVSLVFVVADLFVPQSARGFSAVPVSATDVRNFRVTGLRPDRHIEPNVLAVGDVVHLQDDTLWNRVRLARGIPGDRFVFALDGKPPVTVTLIAIAGDPVSYLYLAIAALFTVIGALLAARRPGAGDVRALATLLLGFGAIIAAQPQPWMSAPVLLAWSFVPAIVQFLALGAAVRLATIFPTRAEGGFRAHLRRVNPFVSAAFAALFSWSIVDLFVYETVLPQPFRTIGLFPWVYYVVAITAGFIAGSRGASKPDRARVRWVSLTLAAGFTGPIAFLIGFVSTRTMQPWMTYVQLTLGIIPFGLGYAILRHRVVDIGFVVNRAIVFGTISGIVVLAFAILEWVLSATVVRVSHVTSTTLELALALALGFSLRFIHQHVDRIVDDLFFRSRHEAERALATLAREIGFVTDPQTAVLRTFSELRVRTETSACAVYVVDGPRAVRVDPGEDSGPQGVDIDDPALVRLRAERNPVVLAKLATGLHGERLFPMLVRGTVSGAVALGPKLTGEAYAPDEIRAIEAVVLALGAALDALQTAALKSEIARVLVDGASLDDLRRTVGSATWIGAALPQPAGLAAGRGE